MKLFLILVASVSALAGGASAQTAFTPANFDQEVLTYRPAQREGVTDGLYSLSLNILDQTRIRANGDGTALDAVDYWNLTTAFIMLDEPPEAILLAFSKGVADDPAAICAYSRAAEPVALQRMIPEVFLPFYAECLQSPAEAEAEFDPTAYARDHGLDPVLVTRIWQIKVSDQRGRATANWEVQGPLDRENQEAIRALYREHGVYIGTSLVGEELAWVMWAVIQHSDIEMMESFLPVVQAAVAAGDLPEVPLKMLIDRVHTIRHQTQIYGNQPGVPLAEVPIRVAVKERYGLE
jgi:hypothetical protein